MPLPNPSCFCFLFLLFLDTSSSCLPHCGHFLHVHFKLMLFTPILFSLAFSFFKVPTLQVTFVQLNSLVTYSEPQHRFFYYTPNSHNLSWGFAIVSNFLFKTKVMFVFPLWSEGLGSMTLLLKMFLLICLFLSIPYDVPFISCWD